MVAQLVKVPHADLSKVSRMVLVDVCSVVVLATGHTATTRMLAVLADTAVPGRDMAAAGEHKESVNSSKDSRRRGSRVLRHR